MTIGRTAGLAMLGLLLSGTMTLQASPSILPNQATTPKEGDARADADWSALAAALSSKLDRGETPQMPTTTLQAELKSDLNSKTTRAGQEIVATVRQVFTKLDGVALDKRSILMGRVVQVSAHSKQKPNGEVMLIFDRVKLKDGSIMPVVALIRAVADSDEADSHSYGKTGARVNDPADIGIGKHLAVNGADGRVTSMSTLSGVMLIPDAGASGVLLTLKQDVHLYSGTRLTLVVARVPASGT